MEGLNNHPQLPCFIIAVIDKDIIEDVNHFDFGATTAIFKCMEWLICNINVIIKHRCLELLDTKPGVVYTTDPKIVFLSMIRRPMLFDRESCMEKVVSLHSKFNATLNELAESYDNNVMNVDVCEKDHFDFFGRLNSRGKTTFWTDVNAQLERFDKGKTNLAPRKPAHTYQNHYTGGFNRKLAGGDYAH